MCQFLNIKDFGPDDLYILNKDLEKDSVTLNELNQVVKAITKVHRSNPDIQQLNMFFFACHGIDRNSQQNLVLNEYDEKTEFYRLMQIEYRIRYLSEQLPNGYFVAFFACCRELFSPNRHCGCVQAKSNLDAEVEFQKREQKNKIDQT